MHTYIHAPMHTSHAADSSSSPLRIATMDHTTALELALQLYIRRGGVRADSIADALGELSALLTRPPSRTTALAVAPFSTSEDNDKGDGRNHAANGSPHRASTWTRAGVDATDLLPSPRPLTQPVHEDRHRGTRRDMCPTCEGHTNLSSGSAALFPAHNGSAAAAAAAAHNTTVRTECVCEEPAKASLVCSSASGLISTTTTTHTSTTKDSRTDEPHSTSAAAPSPATPLSVHTLLSPESWTTLVSDILAAQLPSPSHSAAHMTDSTASSFSRDTCGMQQRTDTVSAVPKHYDLHNRLRRVSNTSSLTPATNGEVSERAEATRVCAAAVRPVHVPNSARNDAGGGGTDECGVPSDDQDALTARTPARSGQTNGINTSLTTTCARPCAEPTEKTCLLLMPNRALRDHHLLRLFRRCGAEQRAERHTSATSKGHSEQHPRLCAAAAAAASASSTVASSSNCTLRDPAHQPHVAEESGLHRWQLTPAMWRAKMCQWQRTHRTLPPRPVTDALYRHLCDTAPARPVDGSANDTASMSGTAFAAALQCECAAVVSAMQKPGVPEASASVPCWLIFCAALMPDALRPLAGHSTVHHLRSTGTVFAALSQLLAHALPLSASYLRTNSALTRTAESMRRDGGADAAESSGPLACSVTTPRYWRTRPPDELTRCAVARARARRLVGVLRQHTVPMDRMECFAKLESETPRARRRGSRHLSISSSSSSSSSSSLSQKKAPAKAMTSTSTPPHTTHSSVAAPGTRTGPNQTVPHTSTRPTRRVTAGLFTMHGLRSRIPAHTLQATFDRLSRPTCDPRLYGEAVVSQELARTAVSDTVRRPPDHVRSRSYPSLCYLALSQQWPRASRRRGARTMRTPPAMEEGCAAGEKSEPTGGRSCSARAEDEGGGFVETRASRVKSATPPRANRELARGGGGGHDELHVRRRSQRTTRARGRREATMSLFSAYASSAARHNGEKHTKSLARYRSTM